MNYYFGITQGYAIFKGKTIQAENDTLVYVTETEYNDVILPAKKINGIWVAVDPSEVPAPEPVNPYEGLTNEEIRHIIYTTEPRVPWYDDKGSEILITVDEANRIYENYMIYQEFDITAEIQTRIIAARNQILVEYPRSIEINFTGGEPVGLL